MSFSATTCLTNIGTTPLGTTLKIYSNPTSPTSPGTFVLDVPTADITGGNCPYTFLVPDGTTSVRLSDPVSGCYCDMPVNSNDLCVTCDLNFNYYEPVTVGNIVAGDLTGSCTENITDYIINWYETGDTVNAVFTSGKGTDPLFGTYDYVHPLTGLTSVLAPSGYYEAIIEKVKINGIVFSVTGGTGSVLADLDCLPSISNGNPILVEALTCSNGGLSSDLPQYEHKFDYNAGTGGKLPIGLSTTFELSANTNFFVWKFKGNSVPDKIKFIFSGSAYSEPILLEYWEIGGDLNGNRQFNTDYPKSADTSNFFSKATCLTGLTINSNDYITIQITPSTANTQTSWTFYCGCLDTFTCSVCQPPSAPTVSGGTSYQLPIIKSTITTEQYNCNSLIVKFVLSGCSNDSFTDSSLYKYTNLSDSATYFIGQRGVQTGTMYQSNVLCTGNGVVQCGSSTCLNNGSTITYEKTSGLFKVTSDSQSTISTYYNSYLTCIAPQISPYSGDNSNVGFYKYIVFAYPESTGNTPCGDGTNSKYLQFHQSSIVVTGQTGSDYWMTLTMPTITSGITYTTCDLGCSSTMNSIVSNVNSYSTGTSYNYTGTTNTGALYSKPFINIRYMTYSNTVSTATTINGQLYFDNFENETRPSTGTTSYTIVPSYSGVACNNILDMFNYVGYSLYYYRKFYYYYSVYLFDPLDYQNFRIYANQITANGVRINSPSVETLVYEWSGGTETYYDPNYML